MIILGKFKISLKNFVIAFNIVDDYGNRYLKVRYNVNKNTYDILKKV